METEFYPTLLLRMYAEGNKLPRLQQFWRRKVGYGYRTIDGEPEYGEWRDVPTTTAPDSDSQRTP